jgi:hypothetical protein
MGVQTANFGDLKDYLIKDISTSEHKLIAIIEPSQGNSHEVLGVRTTVLGINFDKIISDLDAENLPTIMQPLREAFKDGPFEVIAKLKNPEAEDGKVKIILTKDEY